MELATLTNRTREIMLLDFLRECDADPVPPACPLCGYSLKALTRPVFPECGQQLTLTVGISRLRLGWLFAALAPGFFSGIAACFVLVPIFARLIFGDGVFMPLIAAVDLFGWCSGIFAIILARKPARIRFLTQSPSRQRWFALFIWFIHIAALATFILTGFMFF